MHLHGKKNSIGCMVLDNLSFWLDIRIIFMTLWKILKREGVSQPGHATMEEFYGTQGE